VSEQPASLSILFAGDSDEWVAGKLPPGIQSESFAAFWRDEFGTVHFLAVPDEWWARYLDEHKDDAPWVVRSPDGFVEQEAPSE
jgi:hypothetical protein